MPCLSPAIVGLLNEQGMSGLDLSGNYLIQTPAILILKVAEDIAAS